MGHATVTNISKATNHLLHRGDISIKEIVDYLVAEKETVHAGEGNLDDPCMLSQAAQDVMGWLYQQQLVRPAIGLTARQSKIFREWNTDKMCGWDCGNDGNGGEYGIFDSIKWTTTRKRLPILNYVEH